MTFYGFSISVISCAKAKNPMGKPGQYDWVVSYNGTVHIGTHDDPDEARRIAFDILESMMPTKAKP